MVREKTQVWPAVHDSSTENYLLQKHQAVVQLPPQSFHHKTQSQRTQQSLKKKQRKGCTTGLSCLTELCHQFYLKWCLGDMQKIKTARDYQMLKHVRVRTWILMKWDGIMKFQYFFFNDWEQGDVLTTPFTVQILGTIFFGCVCFFGFFVSIKQMAACNSNCHIFWTDILMK